MSYAIQVLGFASGLFPRPTYLKAFDHEAYDGQGEAEFTEELAQAMRFPDLEACFEFWKRQSRTKPLRPDGKPNRPFSASTCTFVNLDGKTP